MNRFIIETQVEKVNHIEIETHLGKVNHQKIENLFKCVSHNINLTHLIIANLANLETHKCYVNQIVFENHTRHVKQKGLKEIFTLLYLWNV